MADKIGRFEVLSEIAHTQWGCIYKASDPDSGQTVALKTINLGLLGEQSAALVQSILQEAESTKPLSSHNIALLYGAGEIDGQFCASMEYVQGKSIAAMLAKQEGFSFWDLQDIARQSCQGLDHAHSHKVVHYSLDPGKVLVSWDGTVKILGFGISTMGASATPASGKAPESWHYMSPEQVRGEPLDARSNIFSLGAILYEMVTGRKAFGAEDAEQLRQEILVAMPAAPAQVISKVNLALSELIMKALSKLPEQRYQSGQDLVKDLEQCKENVAKAPAAKTTPAAPARGVVETQVKPKSNDAVVLPKKAAAAAAGWAGPSAHSTEAVSPAKLSTPESNSTEPTAAQRNSPSMTAAWPAESEIEAAGSPEAPANANGNCDSGKRVRSFSEIDELPPLKEAYVPPPPPPPPVVAEEPIPGPEVSGTLFRESAEEEKPKRPPKEIAKQAAQAVAKTPPKLFLYSIAAAIFIILVVVGLIYMRIHAEKSEETAAPPASSAAAPEPSQASAAQPGAPAELPANAEVAGPAESESRSASDGGAVISVAPKSTRHKSARATPVVPAVIPGQLSVNSTPEGAQVLVDGHHNASWLTPYDMTGLAPGQHLVSISKLGYAPETRTIEVSSGSKSFLVIQLAALGATASVTSAPPGAQVFIDGKDTGRVTPSQIQIDRLGSHTFLVRKEGFLDETVTANLQAGQAFQFGPTLRELGNTDEIKMVGKFKKMFGGGGETAGMGIVSVRTQPKGAQIAVNRHILDKTSPADFYLNPGSYLIDITAGGYKTVHREINVDRGGKLVIDEVLEPE